MTRMSLILFICISFTLCRTQQPQQAQSKGLQKIYIKSQAEVDNLRKAGAEIIVQEPEYVIVKTDRMVQTVSLKTQPVRESDLVQRLVKIVLKDSTALQQVVDSGVDLWQVKNDTAIARAYDIHIERLKAVGLEVNIIAQNASQMEEK